MPRDRLRPETSEPGKTALGNEIATAENIPKKFLDTILLELRNAGLLRAKKGPGSGYSLAQTPQQIRVGFIIGTLAGPLAPLNCASKSSYEAYQDCQNLERCEVRLVMSKVRDAMSDVLDAMTLEEMVSYGQIRHPDLMYNI
ncbi:Rrf2 family transcriptional regulator [Ancylobacter sonchi]|uniref:RrF2 family transcriptional regulator n=1 Tax=Ancylobacter sonchi TaxID=1937790 RepID=UPI001BD2A24D|nr:Rrf2 family transcriptional regulator [Ancylobacter sonchi]MBS7535207.1 Rrf2 family transcriptional regulator [Ancylobacter sonchi]